MTKKTKLATMMVLAIIAASISASSIAYAAQDPKPKDIASSFFDVFTRQGYTADSFFDIFTELQTSSQRGDSFFDVFTELGYTGDSFFDVFTKLQTNVVDLETQVADIQSQLDNGGSSGSVDMFLKVEGIPGESTDSKHKDEIVIESWSWGASQSSSVVGGGGGAGKVSFQDFHFVHKVDKASPKLFLATATGEHIPKVDFTVRKGGESQLEYLKIHMEDVLVTSISPGSSNSEIPTEQVSLNFAKIEIEYTKQNPDGTTEPPIKVGYDLKQNTEV